MSRPLPDDDRVVEFDDDQSSEPIRDDWDAPAGTGTGTGTDDDRPFLDEVPPHWG